MKCDELKADKTFVFGEECEAYKKSDVDEAIAELKHQIWEADEWAIDAGATSHEKMQESEAKTRALFIVRAERNKFLASITHCQGSMNWKDEKLAEKLFNRATKLLQASEKCKAYAEKYK